MIPDKQLPYKQTHKKKRKKLNQIPFVSICVLLVIVNITLVILLYRQNKLSPDINDAVSSAIEKETVTTTSDLNNNTSNTSIPSSSVAINADSSYINAKYLDQVPIVEYDQYTGNEGDSFVYPISKHKYSRGNKCTDGSTYEHGIEGWIARWNGTREKSWAYSVFKLDQLYTSISGECKLINSYNIADFDTTLEFWSDDKLIQSYKLTPNTIPFKINLDVSSCNNLKIYFYDNEAKAGGTSFGLLNMQLSSDTNSSTVSLESYATTSISKEYHSLAPSQVEELSDYFYYGGHSYKFYRLYDITGKDIVDYCTSLGGYLAHINDSSENEFITSTIGTLGYDIVYFGYSAEQSEGNWYWIDGENSSFVNWQSGEPNNEANEEHFAVLSHDGTWNDGKLERDSQNGVIILCEWNT